MIKVSLIIPCYNAENYINKCLDIIINDKLKEIEVLVINDGSSDNTLRILKDYNEKYPQIKVLNQKNAGQAVARNNALKKAKGEYIMFVDIDDFLEKNAIYKMYKFAKKGDYDYLVCDFYKHCSENDIILKNDFCNDNKKNVIMANYAPWGKLISKKLIDDKNFKFLEGKIFEDIAVIPLLAANSKNPGYFPQALYYYNCINTSTTRTNKYQKKYEDIFDVSDYIYNNIQKKNILEKYRDEFEYIYINGILRSNVSIFSKYKEGYKNINKLRKNVLNKFPKLLSNKYLKKESMRTKIITYISLYFPPYLIYLFKNFYKF